MDVRWLLTMMVLLAATAVQSAETVQDEAAKDDAWLHDVSFASPTHGWAVGDRGTIWHTNDGGAHWQPQASGVDCGLRSVWFLDEKTGWAVGGTSRPYTHQGQGVVLSTRDGGQHWKVESEVLLPSLLKVRFVDAEIGWALGTASVAFPSGVLLSEDGGRQWRPVPGAAAAPWAAGDLLGPSVGALAGRLGTVGVLRDGQVTPSPEGVFGLRTLRDIRLVPPTWGWMVGDGALVMLTGDAGKTWQTPPGDLPPGTVENFDFSALSVRGARCWVVGRPGSRVLHTTDAGQHWASLPTGQSLPLSGITFVDDRHGWAVGALGTILSTDDGGQSWKQQRSPARRAALLGIFGRPENVPWELYAQLCGEEGYLGVADVLNRNDPRTPARGTTPTDQRLDEALVQVGASGAELAWRFPLRQRGLAFGADRVWEQWNQANDGRGRQILSEYLVRQIRQWQPEVLFTHSPDPTADAAETRLINEAVLEAANLAADPTAFPSQITHAGLEPWKVKRVFGVLPGSGGTIEVKGSNIVPHWGCTLGDAATEARGRIADRFTPGPDVLGCQELVDHVGQPSGRKDFFRGILLSPGGDARRRATSRESDLKAMYAKAKQVRSVQAVLRHVEADSAQSNQLLAQAGELTRGLDPAAAGRVLHRMAEQYKAKGQWDAAAQVLEQLVQRSPQHPLADDALVWLVQYYASSEAAWRVQGAQRYTLAGNGVRPASMLSTDASQQTDRPERAAEFAKRIQSTRPALYAQADVRFPLAAADRARGFPAQADRYMMIRRRTEPHDAWWKCAQGEAWLTQPDAMPPKPLAFCAATPVKPYIDGKLDEPFWTQAKAITLRSPTGDDQAWPAQVKLARDEAFLYVAIECRKSPGATYSTVMKGPRPRDPDLSRHDRVDLLLDLDRDYATYYRLTIDHRGWPAESCWGDRTWNPRWVVAGDSDKTTWRAEAAIPLDQLTGRVPRPGESWAVGLQRVVPGVGFQSFSQPASIDVTPEGFGLLLFQ